MKEIALTVLQAVLSVVVPIATGYLVAFLKNKAAQAKAQTENEAAKRYIDEIENAVSTAVTATSQTYVDALKKENTFTLEAQSKALKMAYDTALAMLSTSAIDFVENVYGDLYKFLTAKIEENVRVQKMNEPLLISEASAVPWAIFESSEETE